MANGDTCAQDRDTAWKQQIDEREGGGGGGGGGVTGQSQCPQERNVWV